MSYEFKKTTEWTGCYDYPIENTMKKSAAMILDGKRADQCSIIVKDSRVGGGVSHCLTVECVDNIPIDDIEDYETAWPEIKAKLKTFGDHSDGTLYQILKMQFQDYSL